MTATAKNGSSKGTLYLIPSPIGNLGDITQRAIETLRECDLVACEDTRVTGRLLAHLGIRKTLISYHEYNERAQAGRLSREILEGKNIAVITDAGTPGISDPAYRLVRAALEVDIDIVALPGPSALLPALTASGLPTDRFFFEGFLSHKSGTRKKRLEELSAVEHTMIFYESPHRVVKCLTDMLEILGDRPACAAREISKKFEEYIRGPISTLIERLESRSVKGEFVLVVAGMDKKRKSNAE